jgi:spermidine/putrescine-binding protein
MRSLTKRSAALAAAIGVTAMAADAPAATATAQARPLSWEQICPP